MRCTRIAIGFDVPCEQTALCSTSWWTAAGASPNDAVCRGLRIGSEAARPREGPPYDVSFNRRRRNAPSRLLSRVPRFPQVPCRFSGSTKDLLQVGSWASPTLEAFDVTRAGEVGHVNCRCNASLLKKNRKQALHTFAQGVAAALSLALSLCLSLHRCCNRFTLYEHTPLRAFGAGWAPRSPRLPRLR